MFFLSRVTTALLVMTSLLGAATAFTNPIRNPGGSDPHMVYTDGYYYLLTTTWTDLEIARATTVAGLESATKTVVFTSTDANHCCNVWAPEVHYLGGSWYIYYTAGTADSLDGQNVHVLKGGATPLDTYTYAAQLTNAWSIDASVLRTADFGNYLMFSCFNGYTYQSICLQQLGADFISLTGSITTISKPDQTWEQSGTPVNEGPVALYYGGTTYISYSANYCWTPDYCLGLLTWDGVSSPSEAAAWSKSDGCVFSSANGNYGTGHNSFFQSPDGTETWLAYHATSNSAGNCDDARYTMVQPLSANSDGSPNFGVPGGFEVVYDEPSSA